MNDFLFMLYYPRPIVRIMGALCLAQKNKIKYKKEIMTLYKDNELVYFLSGGCVGETVKTGDIIKLIMKNPMLLD